MKYSLQVQHPLMTLCKIVSDDEILHEISGQTCCDFSVPASPQVFSIWFEPWCIKPLIRIDDILVNYALADIQQFDHKVDVLLDNDFVAEYRKRDIFYRVKTIFGDRKIDDYVYDSVIGHGLMHQDLIDGIYREINEKK